MQTAQTVGSDEWSKFVVTMNRQDLNNRNVFCSAATDMTNVLFFPRKSTSSHSDTIKPDVGLKEGPSWRLQLGGTRIIGSHIWEWFAVSWPGAEPTILSRNWRRLMESVFCGSSHPPHSLPINIKKHKDVGQITQIWPERCSYRRRLVRINRYVLC